MPRIDPQQLLNTLGVLLSPEGGIKSVDEVERLVKLMTKFSRKLVSKVIYVQVLKATPKDLLRHFLAKDGWDLLNIWFEDAIKAQNWSLILEMLELLKQCPMTPELLKANPEKNHAPKLINQLRLEEAVQANIRLAAGQVYDAWVAVLTPVKATRPGVKIYASPTGAVIKSVELIAESDSDDDNKKRLVGPNGGPISLLKSLADEVSENLKKEEDGDDDTSFESEFLKNRKIPKVQKQSSNIVDGTLRVSSAKSKTSSDSSKKHKRSSIDGNDSKERKRPRPDRRDEVDPAEKERIKEKARKLKEEAKKAADSKAAKKGPSVSSSLSSLSKIPKIPKKSPGSSSSSTTDKSSSGSKTFEDMLGGLDAAKPKNVKTSMVKNKTAALLEGMTKPSSSSSRSSSKSSSSKDKDRHHHHHRDRDHKSSRDRDHHKHHHHEKGGGSSSSSKKSSLSLAMPTTPEVKSKKEKEADSPKSAKSPHNFHESSSFMDAIFSSMNKDEPRKKKRRLSETTGESEDGKDKSPSSKKSNRRDSGDKTAKEEEKKESTTTVFSFYRDTLDETNDSKDEDEKKAEAEPLTKSSPNAGDKSKDGDDDDMPFEEPDDSMPREVKGILILHRGKKRKRRITWRPESQLVAVQYFELDEGERVNVNKLKFENLREFESKMEKAAFNSKSNLSDEGDNNENEIPWYKPRPLLVDNREPFTPGCNSKEKMVQQDREKNVLQVIYFSKDMTPDTPAEADPAEPGTIKGKPITHIPLEDAEADDNSVQSYVNHGWPTPKENTVSQKASLESQFQLPPALSNLLSSINREGLNSIIPPANTLSQEDQTTLAAQTEAMKAMGILPGINVAPSFPPPAGSASGGPPPAANGGGGLPQPHQQHPHQNHQGGPGRHSPPDGYNNHGQQQQPPPGYPPVPPPFGGPPPGGFSLPPPVPSNGHFNSYQNNRGGGGYDNRNGGRGGYGGGRPTGRILADFRPRNDDPSKYRTRPCKFFFDRGVCRDGDNCKFIHEQPSYGQRV